MAAIAKNPAFAKKVGIKQFVGEEFLQADKGKKFGNWWYVNYTYGGKNQINKQRRIYWINIREKTIFQTLT